MSPRTAVLVIVVALALAGAAWLIWAPSPAERPTDQPAEDPGAVVATADQPTVPASLFFLGEDGWLHGVEIEAPAEDGEPRIRALVDALLAGPREGQGFLAPPLPAGAHLDGVYFLDASSVALDLRLRPAPPVAEEGETDDEVEGEPDEAAQSPIPQLSEEAPSFYGRVGSKQELLAVYSLVNTVGLGSEAVEKVVLLIDGRQPETLAGHVDLTRPLRPDPTWISGGISGGISGESQDP